MSIREIQLRQVMDKALKSILQRGDPPSSSFIASKVYEEFSKRAVGAPRFWPALWSKRKPISVHDYNRNIEELEQDFNTLFEDAVEIEAETALLNHILIQEIQCAETRLKRLQERIERLFLEMTDSQGFTLWYQENFSSMQGTDLMKSDALIDYEYQRLSMPNRLRSTSLVKYNDVSITVSSNGSYTIVTPLEWMFSHYENEYTEIVTRRTNTTAEIVLNVRLKRPIAASRLRLQASSGSSYLLKIEIAGQDGEPQTIHESMVSFPLEIPLNREITFMRLTFGLDEPEQIQGDERIFRLLVHRLELYEEWTSGKATWVSKPIDIPDTAVWGKIEWDSHLSEGESITGTIQILNSSGQLVSTMPVQSGTVFSIRSKSEQKLQINGTNFTQDSGTSTIPLYEVSLGIAPDVELLDTKIWVGVGQWKQRMFYNEWAENLSPQHMPGPQDWSSFNEQAIMPSNARLLFVDHGSTLYLAPRFSDRNTLISLSTYLIAEDDSVLRIPSFKIENANFTFYVNGKKVTDHESVDGTRELNVPIKKGINSLQIYMMTRGETEFGPPTVQFGNIELTQSQLRAVRDPMILVSQYTLRRASPVHPLYWASIHNGKLYIRFNPKPHTDQRTHTKFLMEYNIANGAKGLKAIVTLNLSKETAGPGMGPSVDRVRLYTSSAG